MRLWILAAAACIPAGCATQPETPAGIGMPNPASQHCIEAGGRLEMREGPGGQSGYCHLPDGRVVEEWALFRQSRGD